MILTIKEDEKKILCGIINVVHYSTKLLKPISGVFIKGKDGLLEGQLKPIDQQLRDRLITLEKSLTREKVSFVFLSNVIKGLFYKYEKEKMNKKIEIQDLEHYFSCTKCVEFLEKIDKPFVDELRGYVKDVYDGKYEPKNNSWILDCDDMEKL